MIRSSLALLFTTYLMMSTINISAQKKVESYEDLKQKINDKAVATNTADEDVLVSGKAMNLFIQKKVSTYLTGSTEISLSKLYATYSSAGDKLTFGFNYPFKRADDRLVSLINPLIETDIKDNFSTLYKKGEWQSNIRLGFKYSYFFSSFGKKPATTINFYGLDGRKDQKSRMIRKRSEATMAIIDKITKEELNHKTQSNALLTQTQGELKAKYEAERNSLAQDKSAKAQKRLMKIDSILKYVNLLNANEPINFDAKLEAYEEELAKVEVEALYEKDAYTWSQTSWLSIWGFWPLTERKNYMATDNKQAFVETDFKPWELNAQFNYLREGRLGVLLLSPGYKVFQNNSALADLMTSVDYNQYLQFPGIDTANAAILETNKAFIGNFEEFVTSNFNLQVVLALSDKKKKGGERFCTPGISLRFEKNFGDYSATNWRFGLPLRFKGKEKDQAVNIEPQLRFNNTNNYADKVDYKVQPTFGVNIGLPFTALFKS
jgi:hypothetical protein